MGGVEKTYLDAPALMMHVVKRGVLLVEPLQWIPRQPVSAMIVYAFHNGDCAEQHRLSDRQTR